DYNRISNSGAACRKAHSSSNELGRVGGIYSDFVYITMDEQGLEKVEDISKEISHNVEGEGTPFTYIENREEAIQTAFKDVEEKSLILVIGKGHEETMKIDDKEVHIK